MDIKTYKCPNCGGAIVFNGAAGTFMCESCDSVFTREQLGVDETDSSPAVEQAPVQEEELDGMNVYHCQYCGAQIVADTSTAASSCPYCDNPIIMQGKLSGMNKPNFIIPFKLGKEDAVKALNSFYKGKKLLPAVFTKNNRVEEIKGVYVPFWLYDSDVYADMSFSATKKRTWSDSDFNYTEISNFDVRRSGTLSFTGVPVDGSSKMPDDYMDSIEPFDYSGIVPFDQAYLSGFLADKYDVDSSQCQGKAEERMANTIKATIKDTVIGYDSVNEENCVVNPATRCSYALFPVWMLTTKYDNKNYTFAMNGQTGKFVGELPSDKGKIYKFFFGITAAVAAVGQLLVFLLK